MAYFTDAEICAMLAWNDLLILKAGGLAGDLPRWSFSLYLSQSIDPTILSLLSAGKKRLYGHIFQEPKCNNS